nr:hypothetical protein [Tanacetum cinerariifolium]
MPSLFADTHNVVAILEKSDASEGFSQIIDFLSGSYIHYALTVSPHIYISCIKQFWNTVVVKRSGDVTRLQALVDKKKIVIYEDVIREILRLNDAEGVVFANMRRVGKGFSGVEIPLFENMLEVRDVDAEEEVQVPAQDDVDQENVTEEIADDDAKIEGRQADTQAEIYNIDLDHSFKVLSMQDDDAEVQEAVEIVTTAKLMTEVVTAAATQVVAASTPIPAAKPAVVDVSTPISAAKPKVLKIVATAPAVSTRKRKGVVIRDPKEELHDDTLAETLSMKDKGKGILVEDPKPMKKKDQIEIDAEYARKLQEKEESFKKIDWNTAFDHVQAKDSINETPAQKAAKRRRLRKQAKEDENVKKHLE